MNNIEKGTLLKLFIRNGYVLDFSTNGFDTFTMASVGVAVCQKYDMSKGKSLTAFINDASDDDALKLLSDLLEYYELNCMDDEVEEKNRKLYARCKSIIENEVNNSSSMELSDTNGIYVDESVNIGDNNYINKVNINSSEKQSWLSKHPIITGIIIAVSSGVILMFSFWNNVVNYIEGLF